MHHWHIKKIKEIMYIHDINMHIMIIVFFFKINLFYIELNINKTNYHRAIRSMCRTFRCWYIYPTILLMLISVLRVSKLSLNWIGRGRILWMFSFRSCICKENFRSLNRETCSSSLLYEFIYFKKVNICHKN